MAPASLAVPLFESVGSFNPPQMQNNKNIPEYRRCDNKKNNVKIDVLPDNEDDIEVETRERGDSDIEMDCVSDNECEPLDENCSTENVAVTKKGSPFKTKSHDGSIEVDNMEYEECSETEILGRIKALKQALLESERDNCVFEGALEYLDRQLQMAREQANECPVCLREFESREKGSKVCVEQIKIKIADTQQARDESQVVEVHEECVDSLAEMKQALKAIMSKNSPWGSENEIENDFDSGCQSRISFNMRMGCLTELRNQKIECLLAKQCFGCIRQFTPNESSEFLRKIDQAASQMQKELHIHLS